MGEPGCSPSRYFIAMRKLTLFLLFFPFVLSAQNRFGYFSYSEVLEALPQYAQASEEYELLKHRCQEELDRNEQELTRLYVAYLDGHREFPEPILRRRQNELQQMVDNSVALRAQLKDWLSQARDSLLLPCTEAIDASLARVCAAYSLSYAIDTDIEAYKYINPEFGVDITALVIEDITSYESSSPATEECFEETEVPTESPQEEALSTVETGDEQQ